MPAVATGSRTAETVEQKFAMSNECLLDVGVSDAWDGDDIDILQWLQRIEIMIGIEQKVVHCRGTIIIGAAVQVVDCVSGPRIRQRSSGRSTGSVREISCELTADFQ